MQARLFNETLTIVPPGGGDVPDGQGGITRQIGASTPGAFTIRGRIEMFRPKGGGGAIAISAEGDVPQSTHVGYIPAVLYNPDGTIAQTIDVQPDSHVIDSAGRNYICHQIGAPAKLADGTPDHLELGLRLAPGV